MPDPDAVQVELEAAADAAEVVDPQSARVTLNYQGLPRESKRYLDEVLQSWSDYHKATYGEVKSIGLESGVVEYDPTSIAVGDMVVFVDKPAIQDDRSGTSFLNSYEITNKVPKYDRTFESTAEPLKLDGTGERVAIPASMRAERRCHNCGSYAHIVASCPHERNQDSVGRVRPPGGTGGGRSRPITARYYAETGAAGGQGGAAGAEFTNLRPGQLSDETREALGLGPLDPPPWLQKMKELGYPPMHRHRNPKEDELTIHDDQTGERRPARRAGKTSQAAVPDGAELVAFPGINAPIPQGADPYSWGQATAGSKRARPDDPTSDSLPPPPSLKRIKTTENPFLPPAAAQMTASLPQSGSNSAALNGLSSARSHGQYTASPTFSPSGFSNLPSTSTFFTQLPSDPFLGQQGNQFPSQQHNDFSHATAPQEHLSAQYAAAGQYAGLQAPAPPQLAPSNPYGVHHHMQYPGMAHPGFPSAFPHMHPAYANQAAYAAYAARLVSAGSYPNHGMYLPPQHGMHMPGPYQYGAASLALSPEEAPPPPPPG